jgi:hypothetical protein
MDFTNYLFKDWEGGGYNHIGKYFFLEWSVEHRNNKKGSIGFFADRENAIESRRDGMIGGFFQ